MLSVAAFTSIAVLLDIEYDVPLIKSILKDLAVDPKFDEDIMASANELEELVKSLREETEKSMKNNQEPFDESLSGEVIFGLSSITHTLLTSMTPLVQGVELQNDGALGETIRGETRIYNRLA